MHLALSSSAHTDTNSHLLVWGLDLKRTKKLGVFRNLHHVAKDIGDARRQAMDLVKRKAIVKQSSL